MTLEDFPETAHKPMGDWVRFGSCRHHDPEVWFSTDPTAEAYAKSVCSACPVKLQCQSYAMDANEQHGTWGELTEDERRRIRRKRQKMGRDVA